MARQAAVPPSGLVRANSSAHSSDQYLGVGAAGGEGGLLGGGGLRAEGARAVWWWGGGSVAGGLDSLPLLRARAHRAAVHSGSHGVHLMHSTAARRRAQLLLAPAARPRDRPRRQALTSWLVSRR